MKSSPEVTRHGLLDMQVCVPYTWTDKEVLVFANKESLGGSPQIRRQGSKYLQGSPERMPCSERADCVHIMLDF